MSSHLLIVLVLVPTAAVVVAMSFVMWAARTTPATARAAILAGIALALWAVAVIILGLRGAFIQPDGESIPPVAIVLPAAFVVMAVALRASGSLRSLFTNQQHLIRLNVCSTARCRPSGPSGSRAGSRHRPGGKPPSRSICLGSLTWS